MSYDIEKFVAEQLGRARDQILRAVEWELLWVDYKLNGTRRAKARAEGAQEYRRALAGLGFLVRTGLLPRVASDGTFGPMFPLCDDLVKRRLLDGKVMLAFRAKVAMRARVA